MCYLVDLAVHKERVPKVLHPAVRLSFFKSSQWDPSVAVRAKMLLVTIVKKYAKADRHPAPSNVASAGSDQNTPATLVFAMAMALQDQAATTKTTAGDGKDEVDLYFGNISPVTLGFDDPLGWWKVSFAFFASNTVLNFIEAKSRHFKINGVCCAGYSCNSWRKHVFFRV
jgi:hypothetical protein